MESKNSCGFVTFADILGWKGIWQLQRKVSPVDSLLKIRENMKEKITREEEKYYKYLIKNELKEYTTKETRDAIFNDLNKLNSKSIYDDVKRIISKHLITRDEEAKYFDQLDKYKISMSIELISDTFVITTSGIHIKYELFLHSLLSQELIVACLKHGFLIRGATSYGEYYKQELVFVGAAIDDSASWHEMGEEIGIFFTPKALLTIESEDIATDTVTLNEQSLDDIMFRCNPKLKTQTYETYMLDWSEGDKEFKRIISEYSTILPDIHKKILFSKSRLIELTK